MKLVSPSRLVLQATGGELSGSTTAKSADICAFCAGPIRTGEPADPVADYLTPSFNNKSDLSAANARWVCGACVTTSDRNYRERWSKSVASAKGLFKIASNAHQAHFILNPPKPPFVAFVSDGKMQSLIWRSAVTYSSDLVYLRLGDRQLNWRPKTVLAALAAVKRVKAAMAEGKLKGNSPFVRTDRELGSSTGTALRSDVMALCAPVPQLADDVTLLNSLRSGELWAVTIASAVPDDKLETPPKHDLKA